MMLDDDWLYTSDVWVGVDLWSMVIGDQPSLGQTPSIVITNEDH